MNYILGDNPRNSSYVVGFGENYPINPHHRASSGRYEWQPAIEHKADPQRHLLYGALVGGPDAEDGYMDDVEEYAYSEVAIDYNAGFVGAMAGITTYLDDGQMPGDTPGIEDTEALTAYADGKILELDEQHVTVDVFVHNETILPPEFYDKLSFRYFVDLTEFYDAGLTADDIQVSMNYGAFGGTMSELLPWNEAANIYYIEGIWDGINIYGNVEMQFAFANYVTDLFDCTNDPSYEGLNSTDKSITDKIPVYNDGVLLYGVEPSRTSLPTPKPTQDPTATEEPITGDINVEYLVRSSWEDGASIDVQITNNTSQIIRGWTMEMDFPEGETIRNAWSSKLIGQTDGTATIEPETWNMTIPIGSTVSFGFNLQHTGTNDPPTEFRLNGITCIVAE